ncbi:MAG: hexokinase [Bacteroidetes bacterium]|nr:MAG: hexokinase [Bacteroidota bacterium]
MKKVDIFLIKHGMRAVDIDIHKVIDSITSEMLKGLSGKDSSLRMIPTYIEADNRFLTGIPVLAIDAGGTNFRAALIKFNEKGKLEIGKTVNKRMPGLEGEISKDEFFQIIAGYVKALAEKSDRIGFCFSYPTEILPDKDGRLLQFCKEVQAPGVVGQLVGKNLLETLGMPDKKIVLLNDTVATLLAGKSASINRDYDSFIGYILGTGTNTCYIELNRNITKKPGLDPSKSQIINIESGNFGKAPQTDLDIIFDNTTVNPGEYKFEKMFSGGYFGGLCLVTLKAASKEGIFSKGTASGILSLNELSSEDVNNFITKKISGRGPLNPCILNAEDEENCIKIIENLIDRAAKLVAANLAAVVLKTNKGKSHDRPVLITVEGTIYYKLHNLRSQFEKYFNEYLSGERERYIEFMEVQQSSLVGAVLAALIN